MHNRHVKFGCKIPNRFGKIATSRQGGFFLTHTVESPTPCKMLSTVEELYHTTHLDLNFDL